MTWTKLGDEFPHHCWRMSDAAFRLHTEGLCWSNEKHLDGWLDKNEMLRWAKNPGMAPELVDIGFWEDCEDHFQIQHGMAWQRTAEQWFHQSEVNAQNGRKGGRPRKPKPKPKTDSQSDSQTDSQSETKSERDGTGQDRPGQEGWGTSLSGHGLFCEDCQEKPPVGDDAHGNDSRDLCRACNDARYEDMLAEADAEAKELQAESARPLSRYERVAKYHVTCEYEPCGLEFMASHPHKKFCSDKHRQAHHREKARS